MNPILVAQKREPDLFWLVDLESIFSLKAGIGQTRIAYGAVFISDLSAGDLYETPDGKWQMPRCGTLKDIGQEWLTPSLRPNQKVPDYYRPAHRGIFPDAAEALLNLAALAAPVEVKAKAAKLTRPAAGWSEWKFFAAWRWSAWQKDHLQSGGTEWQLEDRWRDMKAYGYPGDFRAFKTMLSRLRLLVTESRQSL